MAPPGGKCVLRDTIMYVRDASMCGGGDGEREEGTNYTIDEIPQNITLLYT